MTYMEKIVIDDMYW